jgi:hypothetical protein
MILVDVTVRFLTNLSSDLKSTQFQCVIFQNTKSTDSTHPLFRNMCTEHVVPNVWVLSVRPPSLGVAAEVTIPCQPPTKLEDKEKTPAPATWLQCEVSQRVLNPKRLRFGWLQIMGISINIWYSRYIWLKATYLFLLGMGNVHGLPVGADYVTDFVVWRSFIRHKPTWPEGNLSILLLHIVTRNSYGSFPLNEPYRTHFFQGGSRGDSATPRLPEMSRGRRQDGTGVASKNS